MTAPDVAGREEMRGDAAHCVLEAGAGWARPILFTKDHVRACRADGSEPIAANDNRGA